RTGGGRQRGGPSQWHLPERQMFPSQGAARVQAGRGGNRPQDLGCDLSHAFSASLLQRLGRSLPRQAQPEPPHAKPGSSPGTFGLRGHTDAATKSGISGDNFHDRRQVGSRSPSRRTRLAMGFEWCFFLTMQHSGLISAPNELPLLIAGIIRLVELRDNTYSKNNFELAIRVASAAPAA